MNCPIQPGLPHNSHHLLHPSSTHTSNRATPEHASHERLPQGNRQRSDNNICFSCWEPSVKISGGKLRLCHRHGAKQAPPRWLLWRNVSLITHSGAPQKNEPQTSLRQIKKQGKTWRSTPGAEILALMSIVFTPLTLLSLLLSKESHHSWFLSISVVPPLVLSLS